MSLKKLAMRQMPLCHALVYCPAAFQLRNHCPIMYCARHTGNIKPYVPSFHTDADSVTCMQLELLLTLSQGLVKDYSA